MKTLYLSSWLILNSGFIDVSFESDSSVNKDGFIIQVECLEVEYCSTCKNEGLCINNNDSADIECICKDSFIGDYCEIKG